MYVCYLDHDSRNNFFQSEIRKINMSYLLKHF